MMTVLWSYIGISSLAGLATIIFVMGVQILLVRRSRGHEVLYVALIHCACCACLLSVSDRWSNADYGDEEQGCSRPDSQRNIQRNQSLKDVCMGKGV